MFHAFNVLSMGPASLAIVIIGLKKHIKGNVNIIPMKFLLQLIINDEMNAPDSQSSVKLSSWE